jgi:hypothetical protein
VLSTGQKVRPHNSKIAGFSQKKPEDILAMMYVVSKVDIYLMNMSKKLKYFLFPMAEFFADPAGILQWFGNMVITRNIIKTEIECTQKSVH